MWRTRRKLEPPGASVETTRMFEAAFLSLLHVTTSWLTYLSESDIFVVNIFSDFMMISRHHIMCLWRLWFSSERWSYDFLHNTVHTEKQFAEERYGHCCVEHLAQRAGISGSLVS
jgi:hypothetical protein